MQESKSISDIYFQFYDGIKNIDHKEGVQKLARLRDKIKLSINSLKKSKEITDLRLLENIISALLSIHAYFNDRSQSSIKREEIRKKGIFLVEELQKIKNYNKNEMLKIYEKEFVPTQQTIERYRIDTQLGIDTIDSLFYTGQFNLSPPALNVLNILLDRLNVFAQKNPDNLYKEKIDHYGVKIKILQVRAQAHKLLHSDFPATENKKRLKELYLQLQDKLPSPSQNNDQKINIEELLSLHDEIQNIINAMHAKKRLMLKLEQAPKIWSLAKHQKTSQKTDSLNKFLKNRIRNRMQGKENDNSPQSEINLDILVGSVIDEVKKEYTKTKKWHAIKSANSIFFAFAIIVVSAIGSVLSWEALSSMAIGLFDTVVALAAPYAVIFLACAYLLYKASRYYKEYQQAEQNLQKIKKAEYTYNHPVDEPSKQQPQPHLAVKGEKVVEEKTQQAPEKVNFQEVLENLKIACEQALPHIVPLENNEAGTKVQILNTHSMQAFYDLSPKEKINVLKKKISLFARGYEEITTSPAELDLKIKRLGREIENPEIDMGYKGSLIAFKKRLEKTQDDLPKKSAEYGANLTQDIVRLNEVLIVLDSASKILEESISAEKKEAIEKLMHQLCDTEASIHVSLDITDQPEKAVNKLIQQLQAAIGPSPEESKQEGQENSGGSQEAVLNVLRTHAGDGTQKEENDTPKLIPQPPTHTSSYTYSGDNTEKNMHSHGGASKSH